MMKTYNRNVKRAMDILGKIGGFMNITNRIFGIFGSYFSAKFIIQSLTSDLYLQKSRKNNQKNKNSIQTNIDNH